MTLPIKRDNKGIMRKQVVRWQRKRVKRPKLKPTMVFMHHFRWASDGASPSNIAKWRLLIDTDIDYVFDDEQCNDEWYGLIVARIVQWCEERNINVQLTYRRPCKKVDSKFVIRFDNSIDLIHFKVGFDFNLTSNISMLY